MSELDRIKADYELVRQINQFSSNGQGFFEAKDSKSNACWYSEVDAKS